MKESDLDNLLKSVQPPGRPDEYWDRFPQTVAARLDEPATAADRSRPAREPGFRFGFAWAAGLATACVILVYAFGFYRGHQSSVSDAQLAQAGKFYRELEALFPHQIRAIVFDGQGSRFILADQPDVPVSTPYYVKVCGPEGCQSFVTFSGQQVQVNGETCEVLANGKGRIMLVGNHHIWSEAESSGSIRIAARPLNAAL